MYWPIGGPGVYAQTQLSSRTEPVPNGHLDSIDGSDVSRSGDHAGTEGSDGDRDSKGASDGETRRNSHSGTDAKEAMIPDRTLLALKVSRSGSLFTTITRSSLSVWQVKPTLLLATVTRSVRSMGTYGVNVALDFRPDAHIAVVQTAEGYLITYALVTDTKNKVYQVQLPESSKHAHKDSIDGFTSYRRVTSAAVDSGPGESSGINEINIQFRMVMRVDAGISNFLALDNELMIATRDPAALQCIHWSPENSKARTSTELLGNMPWIAHKFCVVEMIHDRPMNLSCWITSDGRAYVVQRCSVGNFNEDDPAGLFQGFCFHEPKTANDAVVKAAINARFSLIAVGTVTGQINVYVVKDYMGNVPESHIFCTTVSFSDSGKITFLTWSPDGYCLLAGYEKGWAMWTVYGKAVGSSFGYDRTLSASHGEQWLLGIRDGFWAGGGCELVLLGMNDDRLYTLEVARNAIATCYTAANNSKGLLHSGTSVMLFKGHDVSDMTALASETSLWQTVDTPASYLRSQWPIRCVASSDDGKYVAIAGRRGLAHYSTTSARWRTFDDPAAEAEFSVRGGLCWFQHFLVACVEANNGCQIRVFSREKSLDYSSVVHTEELAAPAIISTISGTDSLLVYTHDNTLLHYLIMPTSTSLKLVQVGQIGFHGIIRAPPRVRAISWIVPEDQVEYGDPSQDVATASVLFLVDGKLVLLQPSANEHGELKYDMRVIAHNVEYYVLLRDQQQLKMDGPVQDKAFSAAQNGEHFDDYLGHSLKDSLWYFDGKSFHVWCDVQDVLASAPAELGRDLPPTVRINVDFCPTSVMIAKGIITGVDADLVQRRDTNLSFYRQNARTQLFLPQLLRHHLAEFNSPAALHLSQSYQHLPYFPHALEILLHDILDSEVDSPPSLPEIALLPTTISFLSSFPCFLDVIVNCTRKTELRSWRTLFSHLPPVTELFEQSLQEGKLKTAAGYLLVLHTFEQDSLRHPEFARLLQKAVTTQEWELCREIARFLVGIDATGYTLRAALSEAGLDSFPTVSSEPKVNGNRVNDVDNGDSNYFTFWRSRTISEVTTSTEGDT